MTRYEIIGNREVDGAKPGEHIELDDPQRIHSLTVAGHITEAKPPAKKKAAKKSTPKSDAATKPQTED